MTRRFRTARIVAAFACAFAAWVSTARCGGGSTTAPNVPPTSTGPIGSTGPTGITGAVITEVFVGAGDIGLCGSPGAQMTGRLIASTPGTVFTAGDNAYTKGTAEEFANCYDPFWGGDKYRTFPVPGNHEYEGAGPDAYFDYFGRNAGPRPGGYWSYPVGDWHVIALNSNIDITSVNGAQLSWLKADLAANKANNCTLAYWHHPLFSSGLNGNTGFIHNVFALLNAAGVDIVVNGHDHLYERFAPQDENAVPRATGIREFVVGTGGAAPYQFTSLQPNSEKRIPNNFGVLKLTLSTGSYMWDFVTPAGILDSGGPVACH